MKEAPSIADTMDDWILNTYMIPLKPSEASQSTETNYGRFYVGYCHNFVDIYSVIAASTMPSLPKKYAHIRRIHCSIPSLLYILTSTC